MTEFEKTLSISEFVGIVEDNNDPDKKQRVRIRIPYLHGGKDAIPTEALPWSQPFRDNNGLSFSVPDVNKIVNVRFPTGNLYYPLYINAQHLNINLQNKIEELSGDDYTSFVSLCYNYNTQIFVSNQEGLMMIHKFSHLNIKDSEITLGLKDNSSTLYLGDNTGDQELVLGTNFFKWMDSLMDVLTAPYIGNNGVDVIPTPDMIKVIAQYHAQKKKFLSEHIFAVDNNQIRNKDFEVSGQIGDKIQMADIKKNININESELNEVTQQPESKSDVLPVQEKPIDFQADENKKVIEQAEFTPPVVKNIDASQLESDVDDTYSNSAVDELQYEDEDEYENLYDGEDDWLTASEAEDSKHKYVPPPEDTITYPDDNTPIVISPNPATGNDKLDVERMIRYLKSLNYTVYEDKWIMNIIGIRNVNKDNGKITNLFDDYIWLFFKNDNNKWELYKYNVTTTPGFTKGTKYLAPNDDGEGKAMMVYGQYINVYKLGYHATKTYGTTHPCLKHAKVHFIRNKNNSTKYLTREEIKQMKDSVVKNIGIGLNIHRSVASGSAKNAVYNWSEGCQVFRHRNQFDEFLNYCRKQESDTGKKTFTYTLIPQADYDNFKYKK